MLQNVEEMFDLEYELKMKAQLRYLEVKEKQKSRKGIMSAIRHEYLWTPTTTFYVGSLAVFMVLRNKYKLQMIHVIPFMMIPVSMDYFKRDHFTSQFTEENK